MITVERVAPEDWRPWRELRLAALREAPYAFRSRLVDWQGQRDTEDRWRKRLESVPFNSIAYLDRTPAGIVSGTTPSPDGTVELISMYVLPVARGTGVGNTLINAVVEWADAQGATRVTLSVMEANEFAIALYRRNGFVDAGAGDPGERIMTRPVQKRR